MMYVTLYPESAVEHIQTHNHADIKSQTYNREREINEDLSCNQSTESSLLSELPTHIHETTLHENQTSNRKIDINEDLSCNQSTESSLLSELPTHIHETTLHENQTSNRKIDINEDLSCNQSTESTLLSELPTHIHETTLHENQTSNRKIDINEDLFCNQSTESSLLSELPTHIHETTLHENQTTNREIDVNEDLFCNQSTESTLVSELPINLPETSLHENQNQSQGDTETDFIQTISQACLYVNGSIGSIKGRFLVDTGSSICVISSKVFNSLNQGNIVLTPTTKNVRMADGTLLKLKGLCDLEIQLDHLLFSHQFVVADVDESMGILGINFLDTYDAEVKIKKRLLKTKLGKIKLHRSSSDICNRIQLCDNVTIPANSEVHVKSYSTQNSCVPLNILEPSKSYVDRGLLIARTLIDTSHNQMTIALLNFTNKNIKLRQNVTLGVAHSVNHIVEYKEGMSDGSVHSVDVQVGIASDDGSINESLSAISSDEKGEYQNTGQFSLNKKMPDYLQPLIDNSDPDLTDSERRSLSD